MQKDRGIECQNEKSNFHQSHEGLKSTPANEAALFDTFEPQVFI
jgi:hypothetical protein